MARFRRLSLWRTKLFYGEKRVGIAGEALPSMAVFIGIEFLVTP